VRDQPRPGHARPERDRPGLGRALTRQRGPDCLARPWTAAAAGRNRAAGAGAVLAG
jgi:hypothetical protein